MALLEHLWKITLKWEGCYTNMKLYENNLNELIIIINTNNMYLFFNNILFKNFIVKPN